MIGDGNRLAHAAALAVAELPAQAWNPLFIHGPPGLGKTHLLHAIGNYVAPLRRRPAVRYATVESFTSEFVQAVRGRRPDAFRERFRDVDVLLLDDVQFLADKVRTKEESSTPSTRCTSPAASWSSRATAARDGPRGVRGAAEGALRLGARGRDRAAESSVRLAILRKRVRQDGLGDIDDETLEAVADVVGAASGCSRER